MRNRKRYSIDSHRSDPNQLSFRMLEVRAATANDEERSIEAQATTESPVPMPDWQRMEMVPEVLLARGAEYPPQVPLLDSHSRYSVKDQLGSFRNITTNDRGVVGRSYFSSAAKDEWTKVREGHIRDVSAGYQVLERTYVPKGQKEVINGRTYSGPVNVVTKWKLREVSITPIGADEQAKMRGLSSQDASRLFNGGFRMNEELRAFLESQGMPKELDDAQAAAWAVKNTGKRESPKQPEGSNPGESPKGSERGFDNPKQPAPMSIEDMKRAFKEMDAEREKARLAHRKEVDALCELADVQEIRSELYDVTDMDEVRKRIKDAKATRKEPLPGSIRVEAGAAQLEKHRSAVGTALNLRALQNAGADDVLAEKLFPKEQRAKDGAQFAGQRLLGMAEECLRMDGFDTRGLSSSQIAMAALGFPQQAGLRSSAGYHVTGSFPYLVKDAMNKSLQAGYAAAPSTWEGPMRRGSSVPDFKTINRVRLGATPNLPVWIDNKAPDSVSMADANETYAVEARAMDISFSWKLLVNDDMDALSRAPSMLGASAKRTVNAVAWSVITANGLLGDGVALFSAASGVRKRDNLITGSATPTTTTIGSMTKLMRLMRGENTPEGNEGEDVLNLQPKYIVGPAALEVLISQVVNSAYDPNSTAGLQNYNPNRVLTPIIEPLLDASSATAWYLFASPQQVDTVEVTFLQGQETPYTWNYVDEKTMSQCYGIMQTFAAKALNHRGIIKHAGA